MRRYAVVTLSPVAGSRFTIAGDLAAPLSPGTDESLDLALTNAHAFPVRIRSLQVGIRPEQALPVARAAATTACSSTSAITPSRCFRDARCSARWFPNRLAADLDAQPAEQPGCLQGSHRDTGLLRYGDKMRIRRRRWPVCLLALVIAASALDGWAFWTEPGMGTAGVSTGSLAPAMLTTPGSATNAITVTWARRHR